MSRNDSRPRGGAGAAADESQGSGYVTLTIARPADETRVCRVCNRPLDERTRPWGLTSHLVCRAVAA